MIKELSPITARALEFAFHCGIISRGDLNQISEDLISLSNAIPQAAVCELAVCQRDYQMLQILRQIHENEDWRVFPSIQIFFRDIRTLDSLSENEQEAVLRGLANLEGWNGDYGLSGFWNINQFISTAKAGVYGDINELREEFRDLVRKYFNA